MRPSTWLRASRRSSILTRQRSAGTARSTTLGLWPLRCPRSIARRSGARQGPPYNDVAQGDRNVTHIRYSAAACQTDLPNPLDRASMRANTDRMLAMIDAAVAGSRPFLPVRLVVFPEFAHAAPVFASVRELADKLAVPIPNEHTDRLHQKAREHDLFIKSGNMTE